MPTEWAISQYQDYVAALINVCLCLPLLIGLIGAPLYLRRSRQ